MRPESFVGAVIKFHGVALIEKDFMVQPVLAVGPMGVAFASER
jgi:hypothetical protein